MIVDLEAHSDVENVLVKFQEIGTKAEKLNNDISVSQEEIDAEYNKMIDILSELTDLVKHSNKAVIFLKAKGIDRVAVTYLKIENNELKAKILILLKVLFNEVPTATMAAIPIFVVDRLLNIFENDNLALKAHALDVLYLWLPDNPKVQARVMRIKGLQPFYEQISMLDTNVIKMLLELFNKILDEHVKARSEVQKRIIDAEKLKFYQRVGLLEHMSTPMVCNGLLNIFARTWSYNSKENNILMTVFELLKNVKQFCVNIFRGKAKAVKLFRALQEYVEGPENKENFILNGLNITDVALVIEDYVQKVKPLTKDEF